MTEQRVEKTLFGTNGARGVAGTEMTPDLVLRIGAAFGTMRPGTIAIGRDTRTSGQMLVAALNAGLLSSGCDTVDCGILPTPALQFVVRDGFDGGAMITASHNPPEYNGVKIIEPDGTEMGDAATRELEQRIRGTPPEYRPWNQAGCARHAPDSVNRYIDAVVRHFPDRPCARLLVAVDPGSGPACATTPEILRRIGCRVLTVNSSMDGTFPGRLPEPSEEGLYALSNLVTSSGAAFGVAHDGDADRAVFVDENGRFVEENCEFALIAQHLCARKKGVVVAPISTSRSVEEVARAAGCSVVMTRVGSINVARTMISLIREGREVVFGGEGNGGLIFPDHQFCRDGGMTAATMASMLAAGNNVLSELVSGLPRKFMIKGKIAVKDPQTIISSIENAFAGDTIDHDDGVRIVRGTSWALARASGTEPLIRILAEADDESTAGQLYKEVERAIQRALPDPAR